MLVKKRCNHGGYGCHYYVQDTETGQTYREDHKLGFKDFLILIFGLPIIIFIIGFIVSLFL